MKKIISVSLATIMSLGILAGCGSSNSGGNTNTNTSTNNDNTSSSGSTVVTVGRWGGNDAETAAFNDMVEAFTEATGIKVEERIYTDYNVELQTELIGGTAPDVFYLDAYMAPFFIEQGTLASLDEAEFETDAFYSNLIDSFKDDDGNLYAIPKDYSTLALYINTEYAKVDEVPATAEEFVNYIEVVRERVPEGMVPSIYAADIARNLFVAEKGGLDIVSDGIYSNLSQPEVVENLSIIYDLAKEGKVVTSADLGAGWAGDAFGNQKTAMMIEGNWVASFLDQNFPEVNYAVLEVPTIDGEKGSMMYEVGYAINSQAKNTDNAKEFIKFATGVEGSTIWCEGAGVLPGRISVAEDLGLSSHEVFAPHIAAADYATVWQKGTTMDTIVDQYNNYIPSVANGERTLEEALELIDKEANAIISANYDN